MNEAVSSIIAVSNSNNNNSNNNNNNNNSVDCKAEEVMLTNKGVGDKSVGLQQGEVEQPPITCQFVSKMYHGSLSPTVHNSPPHLELPVLRYENDPGVKEKDGQPDQFEAGLNDHSYHNQFNTNKNGTYTITSTSSAGAKPQNNNGMGSLTRKVFHKTKSQPDLRDIELCHLKDMTRELKSRIDERIEPEMMDIRSKLGTAEETALKNHDRHALTINRVELEIADMKKSLVQANSKIGKVDLSVHENRYAQRGDMRQVNEKLEQLLERINKMCEDHKHLEEKFDRYEAALTSTAAAAAAKKSHGSGKFNCF